MTSSSAAAAASGGHGANPRPLDDAPPADAPAREPASAAAERDPAAASVATSETAATVATVATANQDEPPSHLATSNLTGSGETNEPSERAQQEAGTDASGPVAATATATATTAASSDPTRTADAQISADSSTIEKSSATTHPHASEPVSSSKTPLATIVDATDATTTNNPTTPPPSTKPGQAHPSVTMRKGDKPGGGDGRSKDGHDQPFATYNGGYLPTYEPMGWGPHFAFNSMIHATPEPKTAPPTTITPSQVHINSTFPQNHDEFTLSKDARANDRQYVESFARIEFADSTFQVNTHTVIIGRDRSAIKQAVIDEKRDELYQRKVEENAIMGLPPPTPPRRDRSRFSRSYVSEEGGMLGPESSGEEDDGLPPAKKRKTSSAESSLHGQEHAEDRVMCDRQYVSHTPGAASVDLKSLRPSPDYVAFVGIHSPGPNIAKKSKGISRQHLKIAYNKQTGQFEAIPMHNNGFFHEEVHHGPGDPVVLKSGDRLQIKDVDFRFLINGVKIGCTGAEDFSKDKKTVGGKEMSFDFEANGNGKTQDTSDELSDVDEADVDDVEMSLLNEQTPAKAEEPEDQPMEDAPELEKGQDAARVPVPLNSSVLDPSLMMPEIPKKRGPGRPPKNGIMSKRQQRELKKAQQELARQQAAQAPPVEPPAKRKVGRPRKHPLPEGDASAEKRKYKPRKPKGEDGAEGSDTERRAKEKKGKVPRPKSPPLDLRIEDYTEAELQKPNKNYGMLIDEMLSAAPEGLTLKQIYKRISSKYPWFFFHTETKGWESSVRHNLIGNEAFKKEEFVWKRVPGVELDAGKRRKATSPDRNLAAQAYNANPYTYNQAQQHMAHGPPGYAQGQPGGQAYQVANYNAQQAGPGQVPRPPAHQFRAPDSLPNAPSATAATAQQHAYSQHPPPSPAQLGASSSYNSPYPYPPHLRANPPVKVEDGAAATRPHEGEIAAPAGATAAAGAVPHPPQGLQQPQPSQAAASAPSTTPAAKATQPLIEPALVSRLNTLRGSLADGLKRAQTPHAQDIVWSALDRIVGLKKEPSGLNKALEATCYNGMNNLIQRTVTQLRRTPTPDGNGTPSYSTLLHPDMTKHIEGLRNQCVAAIKAKLPEGDAVALVHSAILRTLGLANESRLAGRSESFDNLERAIMLNVGGVINQMSGAGRGSSERGSSAGPRPSPAASQAGPSTTPRIPTPAAPQAPAAPVPVPQVSAGTPQPKTAASPQVPTTAAPLAHPTAAAAPQPAPATATAPAPAPTAPQKPQPSTQQGAPTTTQTPAAPPPQSTT